MIMEEYKNFGSFFYLNSAATLLSYSTENQESYAHKFHFMLPNFVMYTCYFDSYFNTIFNQIQIYDLLDVRDLLPKNKQKCIQNCKNNTNQKLISELSEDEKKMKISDAFDRKNLNEKYNYLVKRIFTESLYKQDYCTKKLREDYFNSRGRNITRPLYSDMRDFNLLMKAMVADRNAIAHPKPEFSPKNLEEGVPDVFPETAKIFGLECYDFGQKNMEVLKAIHKRLNNFERFFEVGMIYLYSKKK